MTELQTFQTVVRQAWTGILAQTTVSVCTWTSYCNPGLQLGVTIAPILQNCVGEEMRSRWRYQQLVPHGMLSVFNVLSHVSLTTTLADQNYCYPYSQKQKLRRRWLSETQWDLNVYYYLCWYTWRTFMFYLTKNILTLRINQCSIDPGTRLNALHDFLN